MKTTRTVVFLGLFVAMNIILVRFLSFMPIPTVRINFGFISAILSSVMFGPLLGGVTGAVSDIAGYVIMPNGPFFPGFTISAFINGVIYGLILYRKPNTIVRLIIASVLGIVFVDVLLNTVWLEILYNKGILAILPARLLKSAVMLPVQVIVIYVLRKYLRIFIEGRELSGRPA